MIKRHLFVLFLCLVHQISAQDRTLKIPDSILRKDYDYLFDQIEQFESDSTMQSLYLKSFLLKRSNGYEWKGRKV